jgi:hypothetical protein
MRRLVAFVPLEVAKMAAAFLPLEAAYMVAVTEAVRWDFFIGLRHAGIRISIYLVAVMFFAIGTHI